VGLVSREAIVEADAGEIVGRGGGGESVPDDPRACSACSVCSGIKERWAGEIDEGGEGIVWSTTLNGNVHRFKVKGELHAGKSKVKTLKPVDDARVQKCIDLAEKVTPAWRLEQMLNETFDTLNGGTYDVKDTGKYIKSVMADIVKEELQTISDEGLELKDITKYISEISKKFFFQRLNEKVGLT
jgi:hypothetical protein